MKLCTFSVVVPVYNVSPYLERCITSLLAQNYRDYEILLIDDGSTDDSGAICEQYGEQDSRIIVYHKKNGGLSSARNFGIDHAVGKYVIFVDSDDYIEKKTCASLAKLIELSDEADVIGYNGVEEQEGTVTSTRRIPVEKLEFMSGRDYLYTRCRHRNLSVASWLYCCKRDFLNREGLRFQEGILHEDVEFTPKMLLKAKKVVESPVQLYHYIVRDSSISMQKNREKNIKDLFQTLEKQCQMAETLDRELRKWIKDAALNSYLNMIQEARMYQPQYRKYIKKSFLWNKAATPWNHVRVFLCTINVRWYCTINDFYKSIRKRT